MTVDLFTKEGSKAPSLATAKEMAKIVGPEYRRHLKDGETVTERAAYATYHAFKSGYVVDGRVKADKRPAGSITISEYALTVYGLTDGSVVTDWYHLGLALVEKGVQTDSPLWKALQGDAHASKRGAVRKVLADPKAKVTAIKAAVKSVGVNPNTGVKIPTTSTPQPNGGRPNDGTTSPAAPPATKSNAGVLKDTEELLSQATGTMAKASPTTRQKFRDMLAAYLAKVDGIIAADNGTPRSSGGTGRQVPTPEVLAARAAKAAAKAAKDLPATGTDG